MKLISATGLILLALFAEGKAAEPGFIFGSGVASCRTWSEYGKQPNNNPSKLALQSWMLGFITGEEMAEHLPPTMFEVLDTQVLLGWISNYCQTHPLEQIPNAGVALINELIDRATPKHPK
jgi:hypothetical protein